MDNGVRDSAGSPHCNFMESGQLFLLGIPMEVAFTVGRSNSRAREKLREISIPIVTC